jgi:aspartyl-tRNA(Asn)/glutamyl-tRNA(Gln) amidotransferase subunit A
MRYGLSVREPGMGLAEVYTASRSRGFGAEVKRRIMLGTFALSSGYYDAYYGKAQRARDAIAADFEAAFSDVDLVVCPTSPSTAFRLGEKLDDPLSMYLSDIFTIPANLAGIPAMSLPSGRDANGLPWGLQIMAPRFAESAMFRFARRVERALAGGSA